MSGLLRRQHAGKGYQRPSEGAAYDCAASLFCPIIHTDMNTFNTVLIANTAEAFKEVLLETADTDNGRRRIRHELALSQRAFFWEGDNKVVITPYLIPKRLIEYNKRVLDLKNVINLAPREARINLCEAVVSDLTIWNALVQIIKANPGIIVSPYAVTNDFMKLIYKLRRANLDFYAPELPDSEALWTIEYLDSKSGFREQVSTLSNVYIPEGFICKDFEQAIYVGRQFMEQRRSCVIKSNMGESGWGTLILRKEEFKNLLDFENYVRIAFAKDTIWNQLPLVVEEFIDPLFSIAGGMPSAEAYIDSSGIKVTYTCGQDTNGEGEFLGVAIGSEVLPAGLDKGIRSVIEAIGQSFFKLGYRGFFDVDFVLSKNSIPYAIESNTRRTGGTHVYDFKQWLTKSRNMEGLHILSYDSFIYGDDVLSPAEILKKSERFLYPMSRKFWGITISFIETDDPVFGYMAIGRDKKQAEEVRMDFLNLWPPNPHLIR